MLPAQHVPQPAAAQGALLAALRMSLKAAAFLLVLLAVAGEAARGPVLQGDGGAERVAVPQGGREATLTPVCLQGHGPTSALTRWPLCSGSTSPSWAAMPRRPWTNCSKLRSPSSSSEWRDHRGTGAVGRGWMRGAECWEMGAELDAGHPALGSGCWTQSTDCPPSTAPCCRATCRA